MDVNKLLENLISLMHIKINRCKPINFTMRKYLRHQIFNIYNNYSGDNRRKTETTSRQETMEVDWSIIYTFISVRSTLPPILVLLHTLSME